MTMTINLIVFPDWGKINNPEFLQELESLIKAILKHPDRDSINLIVDNFTIDNEDAELVITDILMSIISDASEDIDCTNEPSINLTRTLEDSQSNNFIESINGLLVIQNEDKSRITSVGVNTLPKYSIDSLSNMRVVNLPTNEDDRKLLAGLEIIKNSSLAKLQDVDFLISLIKVIGLKFDERLIYGADNRL